MSTIITSGTGNRLPWEIDHNNRGVVRAIVETEESDISERLGLAFTVSTGILTLNSTNEHKVLSLVNQSPIYDLRLWGIRLSWNGGNTTYNKPCKFIGYFYEEQTPAGNYTVATPRNLNFGSGQTANVLSHKWNGSGDGMTCSPLPTEVVLPVITGMGMHNIEARGVPVVKFNTGIILSVQSYAEVGDFSLTLRFIFKEKINNA